MGSRLFAARHRSAVLAVSVGASLALAGCGSSGSTAAATHSAVPPIGSVTPTTPASSPAGLTMDITVSGKQVTPVPSTIEASPGESVALTLTTDRSGELHVHAADPELETEISPGTKTYTFTLVDEPGVYEVELHDPDLLIASIKVQ